MRASPDDLRATVERFRSMGLDPLKWIAGCSTEVEREGVVDPAVTIAGDALLDLGVTVLPQQGPDIVERRGGPLILERLVARAQRAVRPPRTGSRENPNRAVLTLRVFQRKALGPETFAPALVGALSGLPFGAPDESTRRRLARPLVLARLHAVTTPREDSEVAIFDFYGAGQARADGCCLLHNTTLQITDPTFEPAAEVHTATAATAALSPLLALGATEDLTLHPILDAPNDDVAHTLGETMQAFGRRHGIVVGDEPPMTGGGLLIGATVTGTTAREVPNRHHYVQPGMDILLTRPLGDLAPLACYLSCLSDADHLARLEAAGLRLADLEKARGETVRLLTTPPMAMGEVVREFMPPFRDAPELSQHLAAAVDLTARGLLGLRELADRWNVEVALRALPLLHPDIAAFATDAFLMDNATASAPGAVALVGFPRVIDEVESALRAKGFDPCRVGEVSAAGRAALYAPASARRAIAAKRVLRQLALEDPKPA